MVTVSQSQGPKPQSFSTRIQTSQSPDVLQETSMDESVLLPLITPQEHWKFENSKLKTPILSSDYLSNLPTLLNFFDYLKILVG